MSTLSTQLTQALGNERPEFSVYPKKIQPLSTVVKDIFFSFIFMLVPTIWASLVITPILTQGYVVMTSNGIEEMVTFADKGKLFPLLFGLALFFFIGLYVFVKNIKLVTKKGGCFVGTETRLIHELDGVIISKNWSEFTGNMKVSEKGSIGSIELELATGNMMSTKKGNQRYIPDMMYITEIPDVHTVASICRNNIEIRKKDVQKKDPVDMETIIGAFGELVKNERKAYEEKHK